jgi:hypothetical protein
MRSLLILLIFVPLVGCASSTDRLSAIDLGMTKAETAQALAAPYVVRGAIRNKFGQTIEVWETTLAKPKRVGKPPERLRSRLRHWD